MELFRPDTPIKEKSEDRFQRYEFASRIADIVSTGKYPQSLVVGIYGKWGEGKSSVINCIHAEISNRYSEGRKETGPVVIHLIHGFFQMKISFLRYSLLLFPRL